MDTCFRCGSPVDGSDRFCRACGASLLPSLTDGDEDMPDVFVLQPGTARLDEEDPSPAPRPAAPPPAVTPQPAKPVPDAAEIPAEKPDAAPKAPDGVRANAEQSAAVPPEAPSKPMSRREKRIAKKLAKCENEADAADYVYPDDPPRSHWKARLISLFAVILLIAAVAGGLYLRQNMEQAAFVPIATAYEGFSGQTPAALERAFYPELYGAMTDLGYLSAGGYWQERLDNWRSVYGDSFTAVPKIRGMKLLRGAEKQDALTRLQTEYGIAPRVGLLARMDYTVAVTARDTDATVRKSALVGRIGGSWYLLQEDF